MSKCLETTTYSSLVLKLKTPVLSKKKELVQGYVYIEIAEPETGPQAVHWLLQLITVFRDKSIYWEKVHPNNEQISTAPDFTWKTSHLALGRKYLFSLEN